MRAAFSTTRAPPRASPSPGPAPRGRCPNGVRSAMPMFQALKRCPDAAVVRPDMKKYSAVGREVRAMMLELTPLVEPLSIDEAFMDLSGIAEAELVSRYGRIGRRLYLCNAALARRGRPSAVDPERDAKSMSSEITLDEDLSDTDALRPILWQLAETVSRRMKKAGIAGGGVTLKLKTSDFRTVTRARKLNAATGSTEEMYRAAEGLLAREVDGRAFRLIGIGAYDLVDAASAVQGDLFGGVSPNGERIDEALDAVREKFGDDAIVRGRGFGPKLVRQGPSKVG